MIVKINYPQRGGKSSISVQIVHVLFDSVRNVCVDSYAERDASMQQCRLVQQVSSKCENQ